MQTEPQLASRLTSQAHPQPLPLLEPPLNKPGSQPAKPPDEEEEELATLGSAADPASKGRFRLAAVDARSGWALIASSRALIELRLFIGQQVNTSPQEPARGPKIAQVHNKAPFCTLRRTNE